MHVGSHPPASLQGLAPTSCLERCPGGGKVILGEGTEGQGHSGMSMACLGSEGQVGTKQAYRSGAQAPQRSRGGWARVWWDRGLELAELLKIYPVDPVEGSS